jgi:3-hydroxyisobutyrate dehydrogenase
MSGSPTVGIVGLGQMGLPMAERIIGSGLPLTFFARRPEVAAHLVASGAFDGGSLAAVASASSIVVVCVYDDAQVAEVCLGEDGLVEHLAPGSVLVNHTTGDPGTARALGDRATSLGVDFVDAALSGSPADVADGRLTLWVGSTEAARTKAEPVLRTYADPIIPVGSAGDGQWVKLVNNALLAANVALVSEAERILGVVGVEPLDALSALRQGSGSSRALETVVGLGGSKRLEELAGRFLEKDVATVQSVAGRQGLDLGLLGDVAERRGVQA